MSILPSSPSASPGGATLLCPSTEYLPSPRYGAEVAVGGRVAQGMSKSSDFLKAQLAEGHTIYGQYTLIDPFRRRALDKG